MFDTLFGEGYAFKILFAFIVVFGLLALALWLVRRFGGERLGNGTTRGRQPRLAVIDAASVDGRRKLVLVRRDNVEHLVMIGGPSDLVIEPNIVRAAAAPREMAAPRPLPAGDTLPRAVPLGEGNMWPLQPEPIPRAEAPLPRPEVQRPTPLTADQPITRPLREAESPAPPQPVPLRDRRPRHDPLSGLAEELGRVGPSSEPENFEPTPRPVRREPRLRPVSPAPPASGSGGDARFASPADQNLADMAQRLEAALRRPNRNEEAAAPQLPPKPEQDAASGEEFAGSAATETSSPPPRGGPPVEAPTPPPRDETRPARNEAKAPPQQRSLYDSLEQEMASLLGRPGGKG